jgi:hypothetical protein
MLGNCLKRVACLVAAAIAYPATTHAQDLASVAGTYCLTGVREVGSCVRLSADGRFEYFLAYGAYDENSEGTWVLEGGEVVVNSPPYDRRPTFSFKRLQRGDGDAYDVVVESTSGREIQGINVMIACDGRTKRAGMTGEQRFKIDCTSAPTSVQLGISMYGLPFVDVSARVAADKVYVFEFDPGDLGRKRFVAHRLTREGGDRLVMVYADTPIRELAGRSFAYVRN